MDAVKGTSGVLVLGAGAIGRERAFAATLARGSRLIGIVDIDFAKAGSLAIPLGALAFNRLDDGLDRDDVDVVVVATPNVDHVESAEHALAHGKHVLSESPLAIDADDAWRLARQADEAQCRLGFGSPLRFVPPIREALNLVRQWGIGRVESVRVQVGRRTVATDPRSWRGDRAHSGGGALMDLGPAACDLIRRFLGEVEAASGYIRPEPRRNPGCEPEAFALFRNHQSAIAELHAMWNLQNDGLVLEVQGSSGFLTIGTNPWRLAGRTIGDVCIDRRYGVERLMENRFQRRRGCSRAVIAELESFLAPPNGHPKEHATGWDGCRVSEMIQAVYESNRRGCDVSIASHLALPTQSAVDRRHRVA